MQATVLKLLTHPLISTSSAGVEFIVDIVTLGFTHNEWVL